MTSVTHPAVFSAQSQLTGKIYYLHTKIVNLRGVRNQRIYYFAGKIDKEFAISSLPEGFTIAEHHKTGMPFLKRVVISKE